MTFAFPLLKARFLSRPNRFATWALLGEGEDPVYCHMPNPGRMLELLRPGVELWLRERPEEARLTTHEAVLARRGRGLVCLDSRLPPGLFLEAVAAGLVPEVGALLGVRREVNFGRSRLDLALETAEGDWLVETKSCTLVQGGVARFPDAPTVRGARHMAELMAAREAGVVAAVAFMIQLRDAERFEPNDATDPAFGAALRQAAAAGVQLFAILCPVTRRGVMPVRRIPVRL